MQLSLNESVFVFRSFRDRNMEDESRTHQNSEETLMSGAGRLQSQKNSLVLISCCCCPASMFYCSSSKYMLLNQRLHINVPVSQIRRGSAEVFWFACF